MNAQAATRLARYCDHADMSETEVLAFALTRCLLVLYCDEDCNGHINLMEMGAN